MARHSKKVTDWITLSEGMAVPMGNGAFLLIPRDENDGLPPDYFITEDDLRTLLTSQHCLPQKSQELCYIAKV